MEAGDVLPLFEPCFGFGDKFLFLFEFDLPGQDGSSQKNKIRVKHVATAIVVDAIKFALFVKVLHHVAFCVEFARLADEIGREI